MPTMLTISGLPARYFRGMAIASRMINERPSNIPVSRKRPMVADRFMLFKYSPVLDLFNEIPDRRGCHDYAKNEPEKSPVKMGIMVDVVI